MENGGKYGITGGFHGTRSGTKWNIAGQGWKAGAVLSKIMRGSGRNPVLRTQWKVADVFDSVHGTNSIWFGLPEEIFARAVVWRASLKRGCTGAGRIFSNTPVFWIIGQFRLMLGVEVIRISKELIEAVDETGGHRPFPAH